METFKERRMNINWVLADTVTFGPEVDIEPLKRLGSFWGGWRTWRGCQTDNVVCNDLTKASELLKRNFQKSCNFYLPNMAYQQLNRPEGVRLFEGSFTHEVDRHDEIVALHLAACSSDVILLLGFDLSEPTINSDKLLELRARNYRGLIRQVITDNDSIQWVLVDHPQPIMKELVNLENLSTDKMDTVLTFSGS